MQFRMRKVLVALILAGLAIAPPAAECASSPRPNDSQITNTALPGNSAASPGALEPLCLAMWAGYTSCAPQLGSSAENGEDANLPYDINPATGNLFLASVDIQAHPSLGPDLDFVRYYNSQANGRDVGLGPNWSDTYSWSIKTQSRPVANHSNDYNGHRQSAALYLVVEPVSDSSVMDSSSWRVWLTGRIHKFFVYLHDKVWNSIRL